MAPLKRRAAVAACRASVKERTRSHSLLRPCARRPAPAAASGHEGRGPAPLRRALTGRASNTVLPAALLHVDEAAEGAPEMAADQALPDGGGAQHRAAAGRRQEQHRAARPDRGEAVLAQEPLRSELGGAEGRRAVAEGPWPRRAPRGSVAVRHQHQDAPVRPHHAPDLLQHRAALLAELEPVDDEDAVDAAVGQREAVPPSSASATSRPPRSGQAITPWPRRHDAQARAPLLARKRPRKGTG